LGLHTGLRIHSEALTLKWENVDLGRKVLTVEAAYAKNRETTTVPINSVLLEAFERLSRVGQGDYLFLNRQGKPFKSIRTAFTTACRHANLRDVTPHTLRHTFASKLGMSGANDRALQALGRWKEPKMIQRYTHLSQAHWWRRWRKLPSITGPIIEKRCLVSPYAPVAQLDRAFDYESKGRVFESPRAHHLTLSSSIPPYHGSGRNSANCTKVEVSWDIVPFD